MVQLRNLSILAKINQQFKSLPQPKTEESILLRVLVQALVIVGIIATDVAAQTQMSFWAIPLSITGAIVSWRRRGKKNISLKFLLAMGMIVTLFLFFGNLLKNLFDNRLVLAEFLIQLQVLHSFDLPRRKDLGYSMVIGLILMGVAGTLSQTLAFAPWLLLFLFLAIPTLILDYRSRLGLPTWEDQIKQTSDRKTKKKIFIKNSSLSPPKLAWLALVIIALGLLVFSVMPRYQGYKLNTFPVNGPKELENRTFTPGNRGIVNPGYNNNGRGGGPLMGDGQTGPGQVNDTFYYGFNTKMNQNLRGSITKKKIVLRIRSQAPGFWRALAFDKYTGQGWELSRDHQLIDLRRNPWSYTFSLLLPKLNAGSKRIIQTYTVVSDLPNIIPVLSYPKSLYFPIKEIAIDPEGSLRSPAGLIEGLTYTTISQVPYRSRTKLRTASENYGDEIAKYYLEIPPEIAEKVKQKTEELLSKSPNPLDSVYEKSLYLAQAIKQNYTIQEKLPFFEENEDLVEAFLFRYGGGYQDHFATVYTMMLRSIGIPARLVVGLATGQFNPFTGYYIVHNTDAYAMTEVYFPNYGWYYFDPLPGHEIIPPSFEEDRTFGVLGQLWNWVAGWLPPPLTSFIANLFEKIVQGISKFLSAFWALIWPFISGSGLGIFVGILMAMLFGFLGWLGWNGWQRWLYYRHLAKLTPMERLYREMLDLMTKKGYPKNPAQTPLEYAHNLYQHQENGRVEIIEEICQGYILWRYGNLTPNVSYLQQQFQALQRSFKLVKSAEDVRDDTTRTYSN
jgi:transglutaminase-like putative cysteine protease